MSKDLIGHDFEHLFEEAIHESYELANNLRHLSIKSSWEALRLKMEELDKAT